ncbi:hypothetical protein EJ04DRAFT_450397 [Polyplosphaeria fusca]|uniref:Proteasome assembly chaperone 3 n=1 Tax=Polyplosphaeria fusca TaxID=682080 RepID=A0A9P4UWK4_9PLEO|nr:hypothetical protein EJ04DRAFT_450397 [Polyplosphaeria fusca]
MANSNYDYTVTASSYPATTKCASSTIQGTDTIATLVSFADKILITITQNGRLAHWIHVPLDISGTESSLISNPYLEPEDEVPPSDLLPMHHLTATTILGGTIPGLDTLGQTLATQVASAILTQNSSEKRMVVFGLGLERNMIEREHYSELVGLVLGIL